MRRILNSLRSRLLLLVLISALPALILTLYTGLDQRRQAADTAKQDALRLARLAASNQAFLIESSRQLTAILSNLPQISSGQPAECSAFLVNLKANYPNYASLAIARPNGEVICSSAPTSLNVNLGDRPYFQHAVQTRQFVMGDYVIDRFSKKPVAPFAYPALGQDGKPTLVVVSTLDLDWFNQLGPQIQLPANSSLLLVDHEGVLLTRFPDPEKWAGQKLPEAPVIKAILDQQGDGSIETNGLDRVRRLYAFTPLESDLAGGAYVAIGIPTDVAYAAANRYLIRNLAGLALATVLALAGAWWISEAFILRQVRALVAVTRRLASGNLSARANIPEGYGELSDLGAAFDYMALNLEQREDELQQAESKYRTLVEQMPAITYISSLHGQDHTRYISPQIKEVLGYSPDEWISDSDSWRRLLHIDDCDKVLAQEAETIATGAPFKLEYRLKDRGGRLKWIRDQAVLIHDAAGKPAFLQGIMVDISELKRVELVLKSYALQLERSNRELQDFAYIASHDLQEPLRKIQAFGERLEVKHKAELGEEGRDYVERMRSSAARMQALINDLLTYSRVTTKGQPFVPVDLNEVASQVASDLEERLAETNGKLQVAGLPSVEADPVQMYQILQNLVANALKFHRPGQPPVVEVYSQQALSDNGAKGSAVQILIRDNGIGFDEKYLDRIFLPFQRLHGRDEYQGSGIGLAICRKIAERHNGSLTATSAPGQGATFILTLPVKQA